MIGNLCSSPRNCSIHPLVHALAYFYSCSFIIVFVFGFSDLLQCCCIEEVSSFKFIHSTFFALFPHYRCIVSWNWMLLSVVAGFCVFVMFQCKLLNCCFVCARENGNRIEFVFSRRRFRMVSAVSTREILFFYILFRLCCLYITMINPLISLHCLLCIALAVVRSLRQVAAFSAVSFVWGR